MNDYIFATDVSTDITPELAAKYDLHFVPMSYMVGEEENVCTTLEKDEKLKYFYDAQRQGKETHTSQITPTRYVEYFSTFLAKGIDVIYVCLSSGLSNTCSSAMVAKNELDDKYPDATLYVIDSLAATGGMGLLLELAAKNKENGMTASENASWMNENAVKLAHWFVVEDLMYLKRGGRLSATTAVVGTALNIKPILEIDPEGKLITIEKKRGTKAALRYMVDRYFQTRDESFEKIVYIVHADAKESAEMLQSMISEKDPEVQFRVTYLCPIIGAHTGPGMAAVIHMGQRK